MTRLNAPRGARLAPRLASSLCAAFCLAVVAAAPLHADTGVSFAGLKTDPTAPVQVQADQLQISQADGKATFSGNVVVTQSDLQMKAATVNVIYDQTGKQIAELHASGGVTIKAGPNAASSETAVYVVATSNLTLTGHVLLAEGTTTLAGDRLVIDLGSGLGTFTGRVTTTFTPGAGTTSGTSSSGGSN